MRGARIRRALRVPPRDRDSGRSRHLVGVVTLGRLLVAPLLVAIVMTSATRAAAQSATLPEEAQFAFQRGLGAVQQQDWKLAIQHFAHAELSAGTSERFPSLLFNLGVAHTRAGHDLAGMAWLMAYLAAAPGSPNVSEVRAEIARLDVAVEFRIRKILQEAGAVARRIPEDMRRQSRLAGVSDAQARTGDIDGALATRAVFGRPDEAWLWIKYADRLAGEGRIAEAEEVFSRWSGRVDSRDRSIAERIREEIDLAKARAKSPMRPFWTYGARGVSASATVVRLETLLKGAAGKDPWEAAGALIAMAGSLDAHLQLLRKDWRNHLAR